MNLEGKVVVITGASSGIGQELAFQFARKKSKVVLAARTESALREHAGVIQAEGGEALAVQTDVSKRSDVERLMKEAHAAFGRIDILINNAGVALAKGTLMENSEADVRNTMETNFMGGVYGVWAAVPYMEKSGGGQIVFVSSIVGKRGAPRSAAYSASKFAIQGLTESIRPELARKNIRVITICPPGVDTPFFKKNGRDALRRVYRLHPVDVIAEAIIRACERDAREVLPTMDAKLVHVANFFFPRFVDWASARVKGA